jgi:hypothetical protein
MVQDFFIELFPHFVGRSSIDEESAIEIPSNYVKVAQ